MAFGEENEVIEEKLLQGGKGVKEKESVRKDLGEMNREIPGEQQRNEVYEDFYLLPPSLNRLDHELGCTENEEKLHQKEGQRMQQKRELRVELTSSLHP